MLFVYALILARFAQRACGTLSATANSPAEAGLLRAKGRNVTAWEP
jgi:hypothetical protein